MSEVKKQSKSTVSLSEKIRNELTGIKSDFRKLVLEGMMRSARMAPYTEAYLSTEEIILTTNMQAMVTGVPKSTLDLIWHNLKLEAAATKWGDANQVAQEYSRRVRVLCHGQA